MQRRSILFLSFLGFLVIATMAFNYSRTLNRKILLNVEEITTYIYIADPRTHYVIHITSNRKLLLHEFFSDDIYPDDLERNLRRTIQINLSEKEYSQLIQTINNNSFLDMPEEINADNVVDGYSVFIEVKANGVSHKVGGYMPQYVNRKFNNIYQQINQLVDISCV